MERTRSSKPGTSALLLIGLVLLVTFATAGLFKAALEAVLPHSEWLQEQVKWQEHVQPLASKPDRVVVRYDLGRAARRHLLLVALLVFITLRRRLPWSGAVRRGLCHNRLRWRHVGYGVALACSLVLVYAAMLLLSGRVVWDPPAAGYLAGKLLEYCLAAALIATCEEIFFRGLLFRSMVSGWGVCIAGSVSSAVYALLHCIGGSYWATPGWQPGVGGRLLVAYYTDASGSVLPDLRLVVGLFLLGWLLAWLYLRTGSLWTSIGVHGGIVLLSKLLKKLVDRADSFPEWLLGDPLFIVSGVLCWLLLAAALLIALRTAPRGPLCRRLARSE